MENNEQVLLNDAELESASGGVHRAAAGGRTVTVKCGKCGKLLRVSYGMNARCPDPNCKWVTVFSPEIIVSG